MNIKIKMAGKSVVKFNLLNEGKRPEILALAGKHHCYCISGGEEGSNQYEFYFTGKRSGHADKFYKKLEKFQDDGDLENRIKGPLQTVAT
jgi:hypothetical protein